MTESVDILCISEEMIGMRIPKFPAEEDALTAADVFSEAFFPSNPILTNNSINLTNSSICSDSPSSRAEIKDQALMTARET